jgi:hypothetical protein
MRMHADEVLTDVPLVRRLLAEQFPEWAELSLERVPSSGTDNALYRLGADMVVRLPRIDWAVAGLQRELEWLPTLAPLLPVSVPVPLAEGRPSEGIHGAGLYEWPRGRISVAGGGNWLLSPETLPASSARSGASTSPVRRPGVGCRSRRRTNGRAQRCPSSAGRSIRQRRRPRGRKR